MRVDIGRKQPTLIRQTRKESDNLSKPCICIDVSKDTSHVQGFIDFNKSVGKPIKIPHTLSGFENIDDLYQNILNQVNEKPLIILEYTGVYHRTVTSYLNHKQYDYFLVSPLKSANHRKGEIHNSKTDKRDCKNLASMFYNNKLGKFQKQDPIFNALKDLNSEYKTNRFHLQKLEVTLNELIDVIFPLFNHLFSDYLSKFSLNFFKKYYHPDLINNTRADDIVDFIFTNGHSLNYSVEKATQIKIYASNIISGCDINSNKVSQFLNTIGLLEVLIDNQKRLETKIIELAKETLYFVPIRSIPGIGDNLASRLIAELGDISRFKKPESINAFLGIDPIIMQSGKMSGEHLSISKKGNKVGRCILFLMVRSMVRNRVMNNSIRTFYYKKKAQPNTPPKVALFACANKLIRIIYSLCKTGSLYENSISQN